MPPSTSCVRQHILSCGRHVWLSVQNQGGSVSGIIVDNSLSGRCVLQCVSLSRYSPVSRRARKGNTQIYRFKLPRLVGYMIYNCLRTDGFCPKCLLHDVQFLCGRASESVYPEFLLLQSQFQNSFTVLGERDEFQDLYFEVRGAFICNLGKVQPNCVAL